MADHHFMLMWKRGILSVVDVGAPNLRVNGKAISLSVELLSGRIDFGSAAIVVDRALPDWAQASLRARLLVPQAYPIPHQSQHDCTTQPGQ